MKRILVITSTLPISETDHVPAFVRDQVIWMKKLAPNITIDVLAPHNIYSKTVNFTEHPKYTDYRFHYFWPYRWELLTGRGIQPALQQNKLLYIQVPLLIICEFFATLRLTIKLKPDLLYAHWFTPQAIVTALVAKLTRTPFVFTTHASDVIVLKHLPFAKKLVSWVCKQATCYTAVSQQTADKLLYFSTPRTKSQMLDKLHILPMGSKKQTVASRDIDAIKHKYNLIDKTVLLSIGRLVDRKGIDLLLSVFSELENKSDLVLVLCGDGQQRQELEAQAQKLDITSSVEFTGYVTGKTKSALLEAADIIVIPSRNIGDSAEGLPVSFMEATLQGKITVVSDVTGAQEIVTDGKNSFVFSADSALGLHEKLLEAIVVAKKQDSAFRKRVESMSKQFDWKTVAEKHLVLFRKSIK